MNNSNKNIEKRLEVYGGSGYYITDIKPVRGFEIPNNTSIKFPEVKIDKNNNTRCIHEGGYFMKVYQKCDEIIMDYCTPGQYLFLSKLKRFISFNENVLRTGGQANGKILSTKDIAENLYMSITTVRDYIRFFKSTGIIGEYKIPNKDNPKQKNKCYVVNPWVYSKGEYMLLDVCKMFEGTFWHYVAFARKEEIKIIEELNPIIEQKLSNNKGFKEN